MERDAPNGIQIEPPEINKIDLYFKKKDIKKDNPIQYYIQKNQLETIFQKAFLSTITKNLKITNYEINETH